MKAAVAAAFLLAVSPTVAAAAAPAAAPDIAAGVRSDLPQLMTLYRDFHAHPELSMQEVRSSAVLAAEARKLGFAVTEHVGKTGVVAVMANGPGPTVLIRADMDALPVAEQTGLPFASTIRTKTAEGVDSGVMHACGHDTHMTGWIGTARRMAALKGRWSGTLVMIGQPGEEVGLGAEAMLADGLFTRFPKPDFIIGFHDAAVLPAGVVGITPGYALANVDSVEILVRGVGGHGAVPQNTKDPIVLASRIVGTLQTLISRDNDPLDPAVITVGSFHSGAKHNIISDEAKLQITVRSYSPENRSKLLDGIKRVARGEAIAAGMPDDKMPVVTLHEDDYTHATFNTEQLSTRARDLFSRQFGAARVASPKAAMVGEDFSSYWLADKSKESLLIWVGGTPQDKWDAAKGDIYKLPSLHSPFWAPDAEKVIATATEAMTALAIDLMPRP
ncbi:MAG: amidohydrolase [Sphingomicrobium sp.]